LGTSEARTQLPNLIKQVSRKGKRSRSLTDGAIEIRTRGEKGSAMLVATADVHAAQARIAELEHELQRRDEELEDAGIALLLTERLAATSGARLSAAEFLTGIGMGEFVDQLPRQ
jgi:hypothetical protein